MKYQNDGDFFQTFMEIVFFFAKLAVAGAVGIGLIYLLEIFVSWAGWWIVKLPLALALAVGLYVGATMIIEDYFKSNK